MTSATDPQQLSPFLEQVTLIAEKPKRYAGRPLPFLRPVLDALFAHAHPKSLARAALHNRLFVDIRLIDPCGRREKEDDTPLFFAAPAGTAADCDPGPLRGVNARMMACVPHEKQLPVAKTLAEICNAPVRIECGDDFLCAFGRDVVVTPGADLSHVGQELASSESYIQEHGGLFHGPSGADHLLWLFDNRMKRHDIWKDPVPFPA